MTRKECLDAAAGCVLKDRSASYGGPEDSFGLISSLWSAYLGVDVDKVDVAMMMGMLKMARIRGNKSYADGFVDLAGYAACGAECADVKPAPKAEGCEELVQKDETFDAPQTKEELLERIRDVNPAIFKGFSE